MPSAIIDRVYNNLIASAVRLFETLRRAKMSDDSIHKVLLDLYGTAVLQQAGLLDR